MNQQNPPDILVIVADDLGWSDIGAFGGEIDTPNLNRLVARGVRLTNFHASPVCSTTRAMLMTGCDHHEVGFGNLAEMVTAEQKGKPGYEGYLNGRAATIAERLRQQGYLTLMSGKWHLGGQAHALPVRNGFERSFAFIQGEHNHFGLDQTAETASPVGVTQYVLDDQPVQYPVGAYSSDVFAEHMARFLRDARHDPRPVFAYLAFTAPHSPLQAPERLLAKYTGRYDAGPEALREQRMRQIRELGLAAGEVQPRAMLGSAPWDELAESQRRLESRKMEVYAAMVQAMDEAIGRVLNEQASSRSLDNTLVIFLSDNGPSGIMREDLGHWQGWIERHMDNRLENIGRGSSYTSIGPRWAQAQAAPYLLFKRFTTEGGVRTCALAAGPGVMPRRECKAFIHVMDLVPTLLEAAGAPLASPPGTIALRGQSMLTPLFGTASAPEHPTTPMGWEFFNARAIRLGPWKAVYFPADAKDIDPGIPLKQWLLFDLASDPGETTDLSREHPGKLNELIDAWAQYARETGVVVPDDGVQWSLHRSKD